MTSQTLRNLGLNVRPPRTAHAHKLVYETAVQMAVAVWEDALAKDNDLYRAMRANNPGLSPDKLQQRFLRWLTPELLNDARAMLAKSLGTITDPALQNSIYDALIADSANRVGRQRGKRLLAPTTEH